MKQDQFHKLLSFVRRLKDAKIYHEMASYREGAISVVVRVPGAYWEVDFLEDGDVDVERFSSNGHIDEESMLEELFTRFSDEEPATSHDARSRS